MMVSPRCLGILVAVGFGAGGIAGCGPGGSPPETTADSVAVAPAQPPPLDSAALAPIADSIRLAYQAAVNARDAAALAALYAPDAAIVDPDVDITRGADAIRAAFQASFAQTDFADMTIEQTELVPMGDYFLTLGTSIVTVRPRGGRAGQERSRWMAISRRQPDGSWKLWRVQSSNAATLRRAGRP